MQLNSLLKRLNLTDKDGLFFYDDLYCKKTDFLSIRVKETLLEHLKPDALFCINNEPLILFFEGQRDFEKLEQQIWNFNQSPIIFMNEDNWIIKNGFKLLEGNKRLDLLSNSKHLSDFEYFKLITGKCWEKYKSEFEQKRRVDFKLLESIEEARSILINPKFGNLHPKIANSLIGRVIFIRYLIDRNVELNKYKITQTNDLYVILQSQDDTYNFFKQVKDDFNGNLFPLEYELEGNKIQEKDYVENRHLSIIIDLLKGSKINNDSSIQTSLFEIYDFSIIPIEFVSNVYEKFIGVEKQAGNGAYYTPLFLVDYIQKETVSRYFKQNPNEYNCKVLDPACGSGIFLVESLRQIIAQYKILNPDYNSDDLKYNEYKEKLKVLLKENIFGVDKDENAISVAIFSLYITLLDNLEPKSIVGFEFPELVDSNFFSNDFFDVGKEFDKILKKHHFQYILGNPPWKAKGHPKSKQLFEEYIESRKKLENSNLEIVHREIAEAFLVRVSDFNFNETAFIVVSKIFYKLEKKGVFRNYFLNNFMIRQVIELSSVRHHIFNQSNDSAVAPATIIFYKSEKNTDLIKSNIIKHISLKPNIFFETFKLMVIEKYDIKKIAQQYFIDDDWTWKVLVYGNILDYFFIKRLKDNYQSIEQITSDETRFIKGQGLKFNDSGKKISTEKFKNNLFIGSLKKKLSKNGKLVDEITNYKNYLRPFYLKTNLEKWDGREVGYFPDDHRLFSGPSLLITGGTTNNFKSVSAISYSDCMFKSSLTSIKPLKKEDLVYLKGISVIINSSFFSYYILSNGSSTGIEREETHDEEKWRVPFSINSNLIELYDNVEKLSYQFYSNEIFDNFIKAQLEESIKNIDNELTNSFKLSTQEKSLIDYTNNITIPLLKGKDLDRKNVISKIEYLDKYLNNYAQVFIDHFGKRFNTHGNYFEVEIVWSMYIIMMKFKIIPDTSKDVDSIVWNKNEDKQLISTITQLGFENLSDNLFLQKDIKGFEEDYFYIAKPNQYKSWHPALAYLDLSEFIEAFFKINNVENAI